MDGGWGGVMETKPTEHGVLSLAMIVERKHDPRAEAIGPDQCLVTDGTEKQRSKQLSLACSFIQHTLPRPGHGVGRPPVQPMRVQTYHHSCCKGGGETREPREAWPGWRVGIQEGIDPSGARPKSTAVALRDTGDGPKDVACPAWRAKRCGALGREPRPTSPAGSTASPRGA